MQAAIGLWGSDPRRIGPRAVPALIAGAGLGLIGSGLFGTDYGRDLFDQNSAGKDRKPDSVNQIRPTRTGQLHNLCGLPVFVGIPIAGLASAATAARVGDYRWACHSATSSTVMGGSFLRLAAATTKYGLYGKSGMVQRISIVTGLGWLSALSLRGLPVPSRVCE